MIFAYNDIESSEGCCKNRSERAVKAGRYWLRCKTGSVLVNISLKTFDSQSIPIHEPSNTLSSGVTFNPTSSYCRPVSATHQLPPPEEMMLERGLIVDPYNGRWVQAYAPELDKNPPKTNERFYGWTKLILRSARMEVSVSGCRFTRQHS